MGSQALRGLGNSRNTAAAAVFYSLDSHLKMINQPVVPTPGRLREEDYGFKTGLGYNVRPCLKKKRERKEERGKGGRGEGKKNKGQSIGNIDCKPDGRVS